MEGQVLGNRYELIEKIGGGGMALVYKAKCRLLNRYVAVKILRSEFTNDEEFVKRFKVEAQSAASLSHPNIVSIYDVGHENNMHYIIMEFINGVTLKEYISQNNALSWKEAVNISIQVCSAIDHAHRNHIIHRDIKPHNILITKDGIAKVTDFGIARAVTSSTITMVGSTIGSVHYFSPEQARGGFTDEKSDLYSLGIGLYEMITGKLPFDGETPVAVALKHIQDEAKPPVEINSAIPNGVNDIVMKAIKKEQSQRYQTASEMLADLNRVLREPYGGFVVHTDVEKSPTIRMKTIGEEELNKRENYRIKEDVPESGKPAKKGDRLTVWLAVATSLVIIAIFSFIGYKVVMPYITEDDSKIVVKNYIGENYNDIKEQLLKQGIKVNDRRKYDEKIGKDVIISQNIEVGRELKPGNSGYNTIEFTVSDGPQMVKMPDLRKVDYKLAENKLSELGLIARTEEEFSDTVINGLVIRTDPTMDEEVKVGSPVTIYKSKGVELKTTKVPNIVGMTKGEAFNKLVDSKLAIGKVFPEDSSNVVDKIVKQEPSADAQVNEGTAVNIYFEIKQVEEQKPAKFVQSNLTLSNPESYGEKIQVRVEVMPSDTNKVEVLMNETKNKSEFPLKISIPVPEKGSSVVKVYYDDKLYADEVLQSQ